MGRIEYFRQLLKYSKSKAKGTKEVVHFTRDPATKQKTGSENTREVPDWFP